MTTLTPLTTLEDGDVDVFGDEEDNLVLVWFAVVVPIGHIIGFILISYLLFTLARKFTQDDKKKSGLTSVQISAYVVLIGYLIYNFFRILTKLILDETHCPVNNGLTQASYFLTRASVYYFFTIRCQRVFAGSQFAFSKFSLSCIYVLITVLYGFTVIFFISTASENVFEEEGRICLLGLRRDSPTRVIARYVIILANLGDFILGLITVGLYVRKLSQFDKMIKNLRDTDDDSPAKFYRLAQKSAKNAWVAWFSTLLTVAGSMVSFLLFHLWLDTMVTALCVYCSFKTDFSAKVQYYCCECCHNKWLLCIFGCCCCPCCNEKYYCFTPVGAAHIEKKLEVEVNPAQNDGITAAPSSSPKTSPDAMDSTDFGKSKTEPTGPVNTTIEVTTKVSRPAAATITAEPSAP
eukprot:18316_1